MKTRKWKKILLTFVLIGALLGVQVMEMVAFAAETDVLEPSVVCSNMSQLYSAIIQANDGDVIGIDKTIHGNSSIDFVLGDVDKHVTIVRMNADAYLKINTTANFTVQNITFDGNGITANYPMVMVYSKCTFDDVTIENCMTSADGGAVQIYLGNVTMNQCTFKNNKGNNGGHIAVFNGSVLNMTECTLTEGQAGQNGGAIYYNSSAAQYGEISSSVIHANSAGASGGGIYVASGSLIVNPSAKLYGNIASQGADMTILITGSGRYTDNLETLNLLFTDENIKVNGWEMTQDPDTASKYYKLNYEEIIQEQPGDSEDTGDDTTEPGTGEDITDPSVPGEDEGDNQEDTTQPGDSDQDSTEDPDAGDSNDSGQTGTEGGGNTDNSSNNGNTTNTTENSGNTTNTDNSSNDTTVDNSSNDVVTDNSDHSSTDNSQTDNSQTTTDNSDHSTTTNTSDSSSHDTITTNNSSDNSSKTTTTDNSQRSEDNSSVVTTYNYYQNPENQSKVQQGQQMQPIVVNNYIQPSQEGQQVEEADDPSNNIKIDAEGVDVVFEVVDGVYSISIKAANEPQAVQTVQDAVVPASNQAAEPAFNVNWYEIIKIGLLVAILVNVMWKPRQNSPA